MAYYTESELRTAVNIALSNNAEYQEMLREARKRRKRGWLANFVIDIANRVLGGVIGSVVERVIDWLLDVK